MQYECKLIAKYIYLIEVYIYFMPMNENIAFLSNAVTRSPYKFTENMLAENAILLWKKSNFNLS